MDPDLEEEVRKLSLRLSHNSPKLDSLMRKAQDSVSILQKSLGLSGEVHLIFSSSSSGGSAGDANSRPSNTDVTVVPLWSSTLGQVFSSGSKNGRDCALALCDALDIARCSGTNEIPVSKKTISTNRDGTATSLYPSWLKSNQEKETTPEGSTISVHSDAISFATNLPRRSVSRVYREFFEKIYSAAREARLVPQRPIIYGELTPPWLRGGAEFLDSNTNFSIAIYPKQELPTSTDASRKYMRVCSIILICWIFLEPETRETLLEVFHKSGIDASLVLSQFANTESVVTWKRSVPSSFIETVSIENGPVVRLGDAAIPLPSPKFIVSGVKVYRPDIEALLEGKKINDHVLNAFFSVLASQNIPGIHFEDSLLSELVLSDDGINRIHRWYRRKGSVRKKKLEEAEKILIPLYDRKVGHWGLSVLHKSQQRMEVLDSLPICKSFGFVADQVLEWAQDALEGIPLSKNWPELWQLDLRSQRSAVQENGLDCGIFVCINALIIAKNRSDFSVILEKPQNFWRESIFRSIESQKLLVELPKPKIIDPPTAGTLFRTP